MFSNSSQIQLRFWVNFDAGVYVSLSDRHGKLMMGHLEPFLGLRACSPQLFFSSVQFLIYFIITSLALPPWDNSSLPPVNFNPKSKLIV